MANAKKKTAQAAWSAVYKATVLRARRRMRTPFRSDIDHRLLLHCGYHKVGTYWFARILGAIADYYGLRFQNCEQFELRSNTDIFMEQHSYVDLTELPPLVGSHLIRDPRDMVVSGYFYHLWTTEGWALLPRPDLDFRSYQKYLQSLSFEEGLMAEIKRTAENILDMARWNYHDERFIELKYEELICDEPLWFGRVCRHYGFSEDAVNVGLRFAEKFSFKNMAKRNLGHERKKSHLRSGEPGQWKKHFQHKHNEYFKQLTGDALIVMGYESRHSW